jgi:hypothetical protein
MNWLLYIAITLTTFILMEGFTWCLHRYVMHGFGWYLHKDHHEKGPGFFEKNDAYFLIFAIPSWLLIMLGVMYKQYWMICIGAGFTLYGMAYFLVHEVIIHQRIKWFTRSNNPMYVPYAGHIKCTISTSTKKKAKVLVCCGYIKSTGTKCGRTRKEMQSKCRSPNPLTDQPFAQDIPGIEQSLHIFPHPGSILYRAAGIEL